MYRKFFTMLLVSGVIMYLVMFLNIDRREHFYLSTSRLYMTLLMVTPMAVVMLNMMKKMYPNKKVNSIIMASSVIIFIATLLMLRNQVFVNDRQFMKAMISHHSSAILASSEARFNDPEVKKLAQEIIEAQRKEIRLMKKLLKKH